MSKKSKRRKRIEREQRMNLLNRFGGNLNRHPHVVSGGVKEETTAVVRASDCFNDLRSMFAPIEPLYKQLTFSPYAWVKINCYIRLIGDLEVTGLGKIENGIVTDVKLIKQVVRPALVDCTAQAMVDFMKEVGMGEISKWCLDWHSHVNMGVTPSGTDWNNYNEMLDNREGQHYPVMIINKRGDTYCHCYMDYRHSKAIDLTLPKVVMTKEELKVIYDECAVEIEAKCSRPAPTYPRYTVPANNPCGWDYEYNYPSQQKITTVVEPKPKSTVEVMTDKNCAFCGTDLLTEHEKTNGLCNCCMSKYNDEVVYIKKCKNCGAELDKDEEVHGFCDDCLEQANEKN